MSVIFDVNYKCKLIRSMHFIYIKGEKKNLSFILLKYIRERTPGIIEHLHFFNLE